MVCFEVVWCYLPGGTEELDEKLSDGSVSEICTWNYLYMKR